MKFYVNTIITDVKTQEIVEGAVVIDLPVKSVRDANVNLLARDIANLPIIKHGIFEYKETYKTNEQYIWKPYTRPIYSNQTSIKCIYQEKNDQSFKKVKKFSVDFQYETNRNVCPIETQYLTCCNDYAAYELALYYQKLGIAPTYPDCQQYEVGDLLSIVYPSYAIDLAKIISACGRLILEVYDNSSSQISVNAMHMEQVRAIFLTDDMLISVLGFSPQKCMVQGGSDIVECLVKYVYVNKTKTQITLQKVQLGYLFSTDNGKLAVGQFLVTYLNQLQRLTKYAFKVDVMVLRKYLNELMLQYHLVTELYAEYCSLHSQNPNWTKAQIVKFLARQYKTTNVWIESVLKKLYV